MKRDLVEIIEKYQDGRIISRILDGENVKIPVLEKDFVCLEKMSFEKVKSIYGCYGSNKENK